MKTLLILFLLFSATGLFAQKKNKDSEKNPASAPTITKGTYNKKIVIVDPQDYMTFTQSLQEWRRLVTYDPILKDDQKIQLIKQLDNYIIVVRDRIKIDSVAIDTTKIKK